MTETTSQPTYEFPFRNPDLPLEARVRDLIGRLTLEEKVGQMGHSARGVPRLGIPAYNFWNEALHGVARNGRATVFPQAIGLAATWDPGLIERIASAIADEGRAKYHEAMRRFGTSGQYQGLTFWSPNVNIFRDPRWGRGQETWGEDPFLTGEMGAAFVRGLQGDHPRYLKAAACAKHFAVHSGPEKDRHTFDARPSLQDLHDTYLPAFKKLVEAGVEAVMGAYNRLYGEPCCASRLLLEKLLRGEWGFQGHVVSDCSALSDFHRNHRVTATPAESAALALRRGCDLACDHDYVYDALPEALAQGLISEEDIDRALFRTLRTRFRLGMFDPDELVPYASTPMDVVGCRAHRELAYQAALRSIVLLKNKNGLLPIAPTVRSILLVGPNAASADVLLGSYYGLSDRLTTLLEGLVAAAPEGLNIEYRPGCLLEGERANPQDWSEVMAQDVDLVIACMGISPLMEGEEGDAVLSRAHGDRTDINLPRNQVAYLKRLAASGTPIVLLLNAGSPLVLGEAAELADAILYLWYPGQEGGRAAADILFGRANPSGRLPITFPKSAADLPAFDDYSMAGRTYRYATAEPAFPFGFGLSYTHFAYDRPRPSSAVIRSGDGLTFQVRVRNSGGRDGREIVQVYLRDEEATTRVPAWKLVAFRAVDLKAGQAKDLRFTIPAEAMQFVDEEGRPRLEPGAFRLHIGGCSPGTRSQAYVEIPFEVR